MALRRGDLVPAVCGPLGLVDAGLPMRPLRDAGGEHLGVDESGEATGRVINVGSIEAVEDFQTCTGTEPADEYRPFFLFEQPGRIFRAYLGQEEDEEPRCDEPALKGGNLSTGSTQATNLSGSVEWANVGPTNIWVDPLYRGEQWRIIATPLDTTSGHAILHSGPIDDDGVPVGLSITQVGFNWRVSYMAPGLIDPLLIGPLPRVDYSFHYLLEYSCHGEWYSDGLFGPPP